MGGKPRASTMCICGHKKSLHNDGFRCLHLEEWKDPESTWVSTTVCICREFRPAEVQHKKAAPISEQA
jgi:hypothetical protein